MNLIKNPELLDRLASAYALGTLRGGARRRFETLAREQAPVRAAALIWQSRIASMNELQPQSEPSPRERANPPKPGRNFDLTPKFPSDQPAQPVHRPRCGVSAPAGAR